MTPESRSFRDGSMSKNFSTEKYADITQNINGSDLVLLLELREMYCIYQVNSRTEVWIERIGERLHLKVETLISLFKPYLKSGKVETTREVI